MTQVRHVLGISGGKDSAALAIYMKGKYPNLHVEYYNTDTGCECVFHACPSCFSCSCDSDGNLPLNEPYITFNLFSGIHKS